MAVLMSFLLAMTMVSALKEDNFAWEIEVNDAVVASSNDVVDVFNADGEFVGEDLRMGVDEAGNDVYAPSVSVDEGQKVEIKVILHTTEAVSDMEVEAELKGYEFSRSESLQDSTDLFDMAANTQKTVRLSIDLPRKLEKDIYWLRLSIDNKDSASVVRLVKLNVEPQRHGLDIADVSVSPGTTVKAGRSLLATVLLQNYGDRDEKDVKVTVAIPALGISASEFVDVVETDNHNVDYEDVPEMWLQVPATAQAGEYEVVVSARFNDLREAVTKKFMVTVLADERFQEQPDTLVLAVGPESQTVAQGKKATYAVALSNPGARSKAYMLEVVTGDWATGSVSEALVVLEAGSSKVVYVDVTAAQDATQGEHVASLAVKSGSAVLETIPLRAIVIGGSNSGSAAQPAGSVSLRNGLEIALIVLVVLLVIVGLIIGFSRLKKDDNEQQTYY